MKGIKSWFKQIFQLTPKKRSIDEQPEKDEEDRVVMVCRAFISCTHCHGYIALINSERRAHGLNHLSGYE